jgi:hypothetical protein
MTTSPYTGGCQCGAVRFRAESLGRPSICHCRMCQKATGGFYGPFVTAHGLEWTRGRPKHFASSNLARRGFCAECGTPLTYEYESGEAELAIGALDDPALAAPVVQVNPTDKQPFTDALTALPTRPVGAEPEMEEVKARVVSYQHPDHDTAEWPPKR